MKAYEILRDAVTALEWEHKNDVPIATKLNRLEKAVSEAITSLSDERRVRIACSPEQRCVAGIDDRAIVERLLAGVVRATNVNAHDILGGRRTARISQPRMAMYWLSRKFTALTLHEIGAVIGGRNHATVLHAIKKIEAQRCEGGGRAWEIAKIVSEEMSHA